MRVRSPQSMVVAGSLVLALLMAAPAAAQTATGTTGAIGPTRTGAAPAAKNAPAHAKLSIHVKRAADGDALVGDRVRLVGRIRPYVHNLRVKLWFGRDGHTFDKHSRVVQQIGHHNVGRFHLTSKPLVKPGSYGAHAYHSPTNSVRGARARADRFSLKFPNLNPGNRGRAVHLFQHLLSKEGYFTSHGGVYNDTLGRAVLAFRKVNGMRRIFDANKRIFKMLAARKGAFKVRYPSAGRHVEVNISHQVMALVDHGKPQYVFHVSTGAPATPTITGRYSVYSKTPGYNSEGMYYSSYWHGGYAVHGYASVPTYNASHGCVRVPIPDAIFIYNWINYGTEVDTYY